jgi:hypothetical protein
VRQADELIRLPPHPAPSRSPSLARYSSAASPPFSPTPLPTFSVVYPHQQTLQWRDASKGLRRRCSRSAPVGGRAKASAWWTHTCHADVSRRRQAPVTEQGLLEKDDPKVLSIGAEDGEYGPRIRRDVPFQRSESGGCHRRAFSAPPFPPFVQDSPPSFLRPPQLLPLAHVGAPSLIRGARRWRGRGGGMTVLPPQAWGATHWRDAVSDMDRER